MSRGGAWPDCVELLWTRGGEQGDQPKGYCDYPGIRVMLGAKMELLEVKRRVWVQDIFWRKSLQDWIWV